MELTDEQVAVVDACKDGRALVVEAGAGTGKTSTLRVAAKAMTGRPILYLAYNKTTQRASPATSRRRQRTASPTGRCAPGTESG